MATKITTESQNEKIRERYKSGVNMDELASTYGVGTSTIHRIIHNSKSIPSSYEPLAEGEETRVLNNETVDDSLITFFESTTVLSNLMNTLAKHVSISLKAGKPITTEVTDGIKLTNQLAQSVKMIQSSIVSLVGEANINAYVSKIIGENSPTPKVGIEYPDYLQAVIDLDK